MSAGDTRYPGDADVVIVGSGPTGAAYARILSERAPELDVVMLEVGPTVSNPPGSHVKNIGALDQRSVAQTASEGVGPRTSDGRVARPGTYLLSDGYRAGGDGLAAAAFSSNVGGMGAHWTGACPRPSESERITFLPDLDELLDEAERVLGVTTEAFTRSSLADDVTRRLAAALNPNRSDEARVQRMPLAVTRRDDGALVWAGSDVILGETTRQNPNFHLFDESLVTRIRVDEGSVTGVIVHDRRANTVHTIRARRVVVAADALRTPQLLWASGIRPDALGRTLNDQAQVVIATETDEPAPERREGDPGISDVFGVLWVPFIDVEPFHGQIMQLDASPVQLVSAEEQGANAVVGIGVFCAKELSWNDRVSFSDSEVDDYNMPAMRIHYTLSEADRATLDVARQRALNIARLIGRPLSEEATTMPLGASLHYQGTVRMGAEDDGRSVCGPTSEVWDVPGLHVAGNGVIPTATACNPTLTAVALAIRAARSIATDLAGADEDTHDVSRDSSLHSSQW
ncbi:GMC oxidoreductase [Microbacterium sp. 22215]|uniref:GMC oxidoreductase n=1 Tax=Microbacterium sp. 22215 TaxID=3453893 RepID=UPI003F841612